MRQIVLLLTLVAAGANGAPDSTEAESKLIGSQGKYWAFQRVVRPEVPSRSDSWVRTPIDAFILQGLSEKNLQPSPKLDRIRLIRRVTLDLIGLPPTPAEVDAFVRDRSRNAYEKVVDRLLASPHYGERWALKWLDVVRYADTNGFELDARQAACLALSRLCNRFVQSRTNLMTGLFRSRSQATRCIPEAPKH